MVYRGQVFGDVIVLEGGVRLPEGSEVLVQPIVPMAVPVPNPTMILKNGVPVFPAGNGPAANLDLVNELRDDGP